MAMAKEQFIINFKDNKFAPAIRVQLDSNPQRIIDVFNLISPRPTIFITGGASAMSDDDIARTRILIEECIAAFAQEKKITVVDGGTEAGVMDMIGDARRRHNYNFPLIGVSPLQKVEYPGFKGADPEAELQDGHSHFVLVESSEWGGETNTIIALTKAIAMAESKISIGFSVFILAL